MLEIDLSYNYSLNKHTGLTKSRYPVVFMQKFNTGLNCRLFGLICQNNSKKIFKECLPLWDLSHSNHQIHLS